MTTVFDYGTVLRVSLTSVFWRGDSPELLPQYEIEIDGVEPDDAAVFAFVAALRSWPLRMEPISLTLSKSSSRLGVELAPSERLISSQSRPVFTVRYCSSPTLATEWAYVVDQSCIANLVEDYDECSN